MQGMILWQKIEGAICFAVGLFLYFMMEDAFSWWVTLLVFFAADLSFLAYLFGPKVGAAIYNLVHIYGFGLILLVLGMTTLPGTLSAIGLLMFAHVGFDRMLGYGLKSSQGFGLTHLGRIGKT